MKKILFMLIAFCAITISANAQTGACKVKGTNSTVYVSVTDWSPDGTVQLSIDSDANTRVSFEFFVEYTYSQSGYHSSNTITQSFGAGADPNMSNTKTIRLTAHRSKAGKEVTEITSITVKGARCE